MSSLLSDVSLVTPHRSQLCKKLSPALWEDAIEGALSPDGGGGTFAGDDFNSFGLTTAVSSNVGRYAGEAGAYKSYEDTNDAISQAAGAAYLGGWAKFVSAATDNNESWLQSAGGLGTSFVIDDYRGGGTQQSYSNKGLIFETRFMLTSVADDVNAIFLGLAQEGCAAADIKADNTGAMADKDFIGFQTVHTNSGTAGTNASLNFVYRLAGATLVTKIAGLATLVANTVYKVGFKYNPFGPPSEAISVWLDNAKQTTHVSLTDINTSSGSAFPEAQGLSFLCGKKNGSAAAGTMYVDFWACYQAAL